MRVRGRAHHPTSGLVRRTALVRRLSETDAALAVLVAPPGYGKSALLAQWTEHDGRPSAWLTFDARTGRDLPAALRSIVDALADAGLPKTAFPATDAGDDARDAFVAVVRSLADARRDFILVLDDAHLATRPIVHELVSTVIAEGGERTIVALASRAEPPLALGRLRAGRALVEIRTADLAMAPAEASVLLRRAGLDVDFETVQTIVQRTEGWAGGLYLAARSLRGRVDGDHAGAALRGDEHTVASYFREEVLSTLSPDLRKFAIRTSVLDELSGPICDAVLERHGSALLLAELARATSLLHPLDPAHECYRWHGLLREALTAELRRAEPELAIALNLRASGCYQAMGDIDRAIEHAVRGHDPVRTGELLWPNIISYLTRGRHELVRSWLSRFNDDELRAHPPLALCAAHSFLAAGSATQARHWAVAGVAALGRDPDAWHEPDAVPGLLGIKAMVEHAGIAGMGEAAAQAYDSEPKDSPWRPVWLFVRGTALYLVGDRAAAAPLLQQGAELSAAAEPTITSLCLAQGAMIAMEEQDWESAAELTDRSRQVIDERGLAGYPISALAFAASAAVRAHHGRVDEAKQDLRSGIDLLAALGDFIPWYGAQARILLAHASLWLADVVGSRTLLAEASRLARRTPQAIIFSRWFDEAWSYMDSLAETSLAGPSSLTIAELRILRFLPSHRSFREIAAQLGVSANTVKTQAHAVYRKLGAASRSEAVARASDAGLLGQ
jgi:LuxR family transcriptional regulator, maltose regulon positive regulatory protein